MEIYEDQMLFYKVTKSNMLIQKARYTLTLQEQKLVAYMVSQIKPDDEDFRAYNIDIKQYSNLCGVSTERMYSEVKENLRDLKTKDKEIHILTGKKSGIYTNWISDVIYNDTTGKLQVTISPLLKPYLLQMKEQFTSYGLYYVLGFKSKYSIRLYEILKSFEALKCCNFNLTNLRELLDVTDKYLEYKELKRNVLDVAVREINIGTDLKVIYTTQKTGRKITSISFSIGRTTKEQLSKIEDSGIKNIKSVNTLLKKELKNNG